MTEPDPRRMWICALVVTSVLAPTGLIGADDPNKYRELFVSPDRVPLDRPAMYHFYGEVPSPPRTPRAGVYSEVVEESPISRQYRAYVVSLTTSGSRDRLLGRIEITDEIPEAGEEPGDFYEMSVALNMFGPERRRILHINVWSILAGSGQMSAASDLFFLFQPDGSLRKLLALPRTSEFGRAGERSGWKDTQLTVYGPDSPQPILGLTSTGGTRDGRRSDATVGAKRFFSFNGDTVTELKAPPDVRRPSLVLRRAVETAPPGDEQ
jgi:hypothetical protein